MARRCGRGQPETAEAKALPPCAAAITASQCASRIGTATGHLQQIEATANGPKIASSTAAGGVSGDENPMSPTSGPENSSGHHAAGLHPPPNRATVHAVGECGFHESLSSPSSTSEGAAFQTPSGQVLDPAGKLETRSGSGGPSRDPTWMRLAWRLPRASQRRLVGRARSMSRPLQVLVLRAFLGWQQPRAVGMLRDAPTAESVV
ncbi:hypothetical protein FQR65_LT20444 [Abscondita terminalis]|nr:hypothetical protein FQR65_LT20444 [Abscondita terminalis]